MRTHRPLRPCIAAHAPTPTRRVAEPCCVASVRAQMKQLISARLLDAEELFWSDSLKKLGDPAALEP